MTEQTAADPARSRMFDQKRLGRLIVGVIALAMSIGYLVEALTLDLGSIKAPGPGMFPFGVGIVAIAVSIIVIIEGLVGLGSRGSLEMPKGFERRKVLIFVATLIGFIALLPVAGMYIAASLYVVVTLKFLGQLRWVRSVITGLLIAVVITWVFEEILDVPLPPGLW